jgi:hypothetical protein
MAKLAQNEKSRQAKAPLGTLDLDFIRRKISIETVARLLDIEVNRHHFASCFRQENHANGDAHPSLHFLTRKNCATCFGCGDRRAMSTIDFVIAVLKSRNQPHEFPDAIRWFRKEFGNLPTLRGRPAGITRDKPFRVGVGGDLEHLIRSGVFCTLSEKARSILFVIAHLRDERNRAHIPYRTLQRYTGIGSRTTIREKLDELAAIHVIEQLHQPSGAVQPANVYVLTPHHPDLLALINQTFEANRDPIERERAFYREEEKQRRCRLKAQATAIS